MPRRRAIGKGDKILHQGRCLTLRIEQNATNPQGCEFDHEFLNVNLPDGSLAKKALCEELHLEILLWQKKRARLVFRERTDYWAQRIGVKYRRLAPSNPRRLWGSCSWRNDIRINWRLIMAPPELLDYVIVHELCHVVHKNHSRPFWNLVATHMPDWKIRRQRLRQLDPAADF